MTLTLILSVLIVLSKHETKTSVVPCYQQPHSGTCLTFFANVMILSSVHIVQPDSSIISLSQSSTAIYPSPTQSSPLSPNKTVQAAHPCLCLPPGPNYRGLDMLVIAEHCGKALLQASLGGNVSPLENVCCFSWQRGSERARRIQWRHSHREGYSSEIRNGLLTPPGGFQTHLHMS